MPAAPIEHSEELLLAALCQGVDGESFWPEFQSRLSGYRFSTPVRQLIFDAASSIERRGSGITRERLQHALMMARFPALDVSRYFAAGALNRAAVLEAVSVLESARSEAPAVRPAKTPGDQL